jgi:hypothetical protein
VHLAQVSSTRDCHARTLRGLPEAEEGEGENARPLLGEVQGNVPCGGFLGTQRSDPQKKELAMPTAQRTQNCLVTIPDN